MPANVMNSVFLLFLIRAATSDYFYNRLICWFFSVNWLAGFVENILNTEDIYLKYFKSVLLQYFLTRLK